MKHLSLFLAALALPVRADIPAAEIQTILAVGPEGKGNAEASAAWARLTAGAQGSDIPALLKAMNGASGLAANWLRGAVSAVEQRSAGKLPLDALKAFAADTANAPQPRVLAFDLIHRADEKLWDSLVPGLLEDPAPALRREPVRRLTEEGKASGNVAVLRRALDAARDEDQIRAAAEVLQEKGETVDLPRQFGFLMDWHVAGPFDNTDRKGFAAVFPPEVTPDKMDQAAEFEGKAAKPDEKLSCRWTAFTSADAFGKVDLNKPLGMVKNVTGYAFTTFTSAEERPAELRLGCKNAWKVWCNGELLFSRDEYHRGAQIDQYTLPVKLKKGANSILVKCCQNEQTELWTVEWEFQLRVCDSTGTAILSTDRKPTPAAALKKGERGK